MVNEKSIRCTAHDVRGILSGAKHQTRRIMKPQPQYFEQQPHWRWGSGPVGPFAIASGDIPGCFGKYMPGEQLWVREAWAVVQTESQADFNAAESLYWYRADGERPGVKWKPSIHMPRVASRLTLEIAGVTVERVQDISYDDAEAEGTWAACEDDPAIQNSASYAAVAAGRRSVELVDYFAALWNKVNGPNAWERNDWVWKVEFRLLEATP